MLSTAAVLPAPDVLDRLLQLDQTVVDALPIGLYICDADGRIARANRRAEELWGRTAASLDDTQRFTGSNRIETLTGVFIPPDATPMAQAIRHGATFKNVEARMENP